MKEVAQSLGLNLLMWWSVGLSLNLCLNLKVVMSSRYLQLQLIKANLF